MKKIKILQGITVILFAFIILITVIGLYLIWFSNFYHSIDYKHSDRYSSGFGALKHFGISFILFHSPNFICSITNHPENYYAWVQLQTGIIYV